MFNVKKDIYANPGDIINPTDYKRTIVVIDSRFRDPGSYSPTDYMMKLMKPYKNIIRVRMTSTEFPNVFYTFSEERYNVKFRIFYDIANPQGNMVRYYFPLQIKTGNYSAEAMRTEIDGKLSLMSSQDINGELGFNPELTIQLDNITARYTISATNKNTPFFGIDFTEETLAKRRCDWGLGYYLGFRNRVYEPSTNWEHEAESFMDTNGNPNLYLELNDYVSCDLNNFENNIHCFAVMIQKENKYFSIFGDEMSFLTREIVFPQPRDISQFRVCLRDVYGNIIDMRDTDWTFTLELTEVMNPRLYGFYKDYNRIE
jgi:hypothetical protein